MTTRALTCPRVVALDYDGTLTDDGRVAPAVLDALADTRRSGVRTVLVTGRILDELTAVFPDVADHFDALVVENGTVVTTANGSRRLAPALVRRPP